MTPFKLLLGLSGLSQREASDFLKISMSSVDKMSRGKLRAKNEIIDELCELISSQRKVALLWNFLRRAEGDIEIEYPSDDSEAQSLGWPSVGAWAGMAAQFISQRETQVRLVKRAPTVSSAEPV